MKSYIKIAKILNSWNFIHSKPKKKDGQIINSSDGEAVNQCTQPGFGMSYYEGSRREISSALILPVHMEHHGD